MDYKEKIRAHIAKGETDKAITLLMEYTQQENSPYKDDAVLISSQYRQWKREVNLGIDQSSSDLRRIELSIMELLNQKNTPAPAINVPQTHAQSAVVAPEKSNKNLFIYGGIGLVLLLLVFAISSIGGDDFDSNDGEEDGISNEQQQDFQPSEATPPEEGEAPVNSSNVAEIVYSDDYGNEIGEFVQEVGTKIWFESKLPDHQVGARFTEVRRDANSVFLYDEGRDVTIRLDIENSGVWYYEGNEQERKINSITSYSGPSTTYN